MNKANKQINNNKQRATLGKQTKETTTTKMYQRWRHVGGVMTVHPKKDFVLPQFKYPSFAKKTQQPSTTENKHFFYLDSSFCAVFVSHVTSHFLSRPNPSWFLIFNKKISVCQPLNNCRTN